MKVRDPNGPIQVAPVGLLGLLSLKTGGQMPDAMRQDVSPTVDLEAWWLRQKRVVDNVNRGITLAAGTVDAFVDFSPNAIAVPEAEWWFVHSYSCKASLTDPLDSIQGVRLAMQWNQVGTLRYRWLGEPGPAFISATAGARALLLAEGFWCPPGSALGFYAGFISGPGGLSVDVKGLDYTVCPV